MIYIYEYFSLNFYNVFKINFMYFLKGVFYISDMIRDFNYGAVL